MRLPMRPARLVSTVLMAMPGSVIFAVAAAATLVAAVAAGTGVATARFACAAAAGFRRCRCEACVAGAGADTFPDPRPLPRVVPCPSLQERWLERSVLYFASNCSERSARPGVTKITATLAEVTLALGSSAQRSMPTSIPLHSYPRRADPHPPNMGGWRRLWHFDAESGRRPPHQ